MTPEQLDRLATAVMGWVKVELFDEGYYREHREDGSVGQIEAWRFQPHKDLNLALPLLNAYCKKHHCFWSLNYNRETFWYSLKIGYPYSIRYTAGYLSLPDTTLYKDPDNLAPEICKAIDERLERVSAPHE